MKFSEILPARLSNQLLSERKGDSPAAVTAWLGAVQAQDFAAAKGALGLRLSGATDAAIEQAFNAGDILRTHIMRPTWHFVTPADIRSLLALTAPRVHAANRARYHQLELDDALFARCHAVFAKALRDGQHLTRSEMGRHLAQSRIPATGQRLAYILMQAELEALICSGPRRGKQFTYALLDERAPAAKTLSRDEALAQWTLHYFLSHGPAQLKDFAWWSGLTVQDAQRGVEVVRSRLAHEEIDGKTYWFSPEARPARLPSPTAWLLSIFDEYTIAYNDRSALSEKRYLEKMLTMGTALTAVLILDGKVAGTWKRAVQKKQVAITLDPFQPLSAAEHDAIEAAAVRYGEFLERPCTVTWPAKKERSKKSANPAGVLAQ
jgi:hypothetical protein